MSIEPLAWEAGHLRLLDQTRLPNDEVWLELADHTQVAEAINSMRVRGAPAIGVAGAFGLALAALASAAADHESLLRDLRTAADELIATRPTGANLAWAVKRTLAAAESASDIESARTSVLGEAKAIQREDIEGNMALGRHAL